MASRYGRKKRRKHLAQLAQQEMTIHLLAEAGRQAKAEKRLASDQMAALMQRLERWDQHLRDLLGGHTAFTFMPATIKEGAFGHLRQIGIYPPMNYPLTASAFEATVETLSYEMQSILRIVGDISGPDLMTLKRYVHMEILSGRDPYADPRSGKRYDWNYAVSEATLNDGLTDHQIIHIAEQIALQFHQRLKQELGRGQNGRKRIG